MVNDGWTRIICLYNDAKIGVNLMAYLKQFNNDDDDYDWINGAGPIGPDWINSAGPITESEIPWWEQLWSGTKEVLTTGAEVFEKVAPAIFDRPELTPAYPGSIPTLKVPTVRIEIDPRTGLQRTITDSPYFPGQPLPPDTIIVTLPSGQQVIRKIQRAGIMPEWGMPLLLLGGGILLMSVMKKPKRR